MTRPLESVALDDLDRVAGGFQTMCEMTPQQRSEVLKRMPHVGTQRYRECRINEFCARRGQGQSFRDADAASQQICRDRERQAGEAP